MEFQISTDELRKALSRAQGVVERKATMPILSHVLLQARPGLLSVTAFDLDVGLTSELPTQVSAVGAVALSAKHLLHIVRNTPEDQVSFSRQTKDKTKISLNVAADADADEIPGQDNDSLQAQPDQTPSIKDEPATANMRDWIRGRLDERKMSLEAACGMAKLPLSTSLERLTKAEFQALRGALIAPEIR